ncbi:MAG: hypothetical protein KZQ94_01240 [Candidatus Thiodiazotropha sp. (ex Troendleina suluensis)]|nr:hypothetical protein [Candidatus Thiodiazotropha sp. (ex Troendleina suluensis)]
MSSMNDYYVNSNLALAAYSEFTQGMSLDEYKDALRNDGDGMSPTQARDFADNWRVLDQYDGRVEETYTDEFGQEHTFLNPTGLSVTAFEHVETGEQVVAIRGTTLTDLNDIVTDVIDLIALGTSENQAQYAALSVKVQDWLDNGTLQSGFNVTGHSLGGFLATNLTFDYPTDIAHTYIYNAPGLTGVLGDLRQAIALALSPVVEIPTTFPDVLPVSNIVATGDVASSLGLYITPPIVMSVETRSPLGAHSMVRVTDALAIYNLFSAIDPNADLSNLTPILDAASNRGNETLENIIHSLSDLLINPIDVPIDEREPLYVAIQAIETELFVDRTVANPQLKPIYQNLNLISLPDLTQVQIIENANNDIAYRYALAHLNPFAITGRESLYDDHNQYDELELYDPATQTGELTTAYLEDRTHYLRASLQRNEWDVQHLTAASGDGVVYWDANAGEFASASDPEIVVRQDWDDLVHYRFGGDGDEGNDELAGGSCLPAMINSNRLMGAGRLLSPEISPRKIDDDGCISFKAVAIDILLSMSAHNLSLPRLLSCCSSLFSSCRKGPVSPSWARVFSFAPKEQSPKERAPGRHAPGGSAAMLGKTGVPETRCAQTVRPA